MTFGHVMEWVTKGLEAVGVLVLVAGLVVAFVRAAAGLRDRKDRPAVFTVLRRTIGRSILLGLEILVAADIIRTVAVEPSIENVAVLGLIVLIRTFLSFSLEVEIEGTLPWRRTGAGTAGATGDAV